MKSIKIIFGLAVAAFLGVILCLVCIFFVPEQEKIEEQAEISETVTTEENSISEEELTILAEEEVRRFKESYGVDIKLSEMKKQLILCALSAWLVA